MLLSATGTSVTSVSAGVVPATAPAKKEARHHVRAGLNRLSSSTTRTLRDGGRKVGGKPVHDGGFVDAEHRCRGIDLRHIQDWRRVST